MTHKKMPCVILKKGSLIYQVHLENEQSSTRWEQHGGVSTNSHAKMYKQYHISHLAFGVYKLSHISYHIYVKISLKFIEYPNFKLNNQCDHKDCLLQECPKTYYSYQNKHHWCPCKVCIGVATIDQNQYPHRNFQQQEHDHFPLGCFFPHVLINSVSCVYG